MGQSLVRNFVHIVFSTKHREPYIQACYEKRLHGYLWGICAGLECEPIKIGGYTDHVHLLCMLSKKVALMKLLEDLKSDSSRWMKTIDVGLKDFYWQNGYGAFSVNSGEVDRVVAYIGDQKKHHDGLTFQNEYRGILKGYGMQYDERFVWD